MFSLQRKCEQYWPEDKSVPQVNDRGVKVTLVSLEHFADFDIREFHVSNVSVTASSSYTQRLRYMEAETV